MHTHIIIVLCTRGTNLFYTESNTKKLSQTPQWIFQMQFKKNRTLISTCAEVGSTLQLSLCLPRHAIPHWLDAKIGALWQTGPLLLHFLFLLLKISAFMSPPVCLSHYYDKLPDVPLMTLPDKHKPKHPLGDHVCGDSDCWKLLDLFKSVPFWQQHWHRCVLYTNTHHIIIPSFL